MCLIIASKNGETVSDSILTQAWRDNPHGWGIMYPSRGKVRTWKGFTLKRMLRKVGLLRRWGNKPHVIHFRYATHGTRNRQNTHPFKVRKDLYMAHNGIIDIDRPNKDYSDTWHYAEFLKSLGVTSGLLSDSLLEAIGTSIGSGNKLAFLTGAGEIKFANENCGLWHTSNVWLSNDYSLPSARSYDLGMKKAFGQSRHGWNFRDEFDGWAGHAGGAWSKRGDDTLDATEDDGAEQCDYCGVPAELGDLVPYDHDAICKECYASEVSYLKAYGDYRVDGDCDSCGRPTVIDDLHEYDNGKFCIGCLRSHMADVRTAVPVFTGK